MHPDKLRYLKERLGWIYTPNIAGLTFSFSNSWNFNKPHLFQRHEPSFPENILLSRFRSSLNIQAGPDLTERIKSQELSLFNFALVNSNNSDLLISAPAIFQTPAIILSRNLDLPFSKASLNWDGQIYDLNDNSLRLVFNNKGIPQSQTLITQLPFNNSITAYTFFSIESHDIDSPEFYDPFLILDWKLSNQFIRS